MSIWPQRRPTVPAYARAWLDIGERVLTFGWTPYGDLVLASPRGLWVTDHQPVTTAATRTTIGYGSGSHADGPSGRRLLWEFIVSAKWSGDVLTLTAAEEVAAQKTSGQAEPGHHLGRGKIMKRLAPITLPLRESGDLPRVVRQRVDRSVAISHRRPLSSGTTVLLVARRISGRDGLLWYAVFDRDSEADDPQARQQATALLESAAAAQAPRPYLD